MLQEVHDADPTEDENVPAAQRMQSLAASFAGEMDALCFPAAQAMHARSVPELYVPRAHAAQSVAAADPVLVPAPQVMQTSPDWPLWPEYLPATHAMQLLLDAAGVLTPACHSVDDV